MTTDQAVNPLAAELNERLAKAAPEVLAMLSSYGQRAYFPKGILSQSAEAKQKAHRFNATIGIATEGGAPMFLSSLQSHLDELDPKDVYPYAPPAGRPGLRDRWRDKIAAENPSLEGKRWGQPITTSAITHGLSLCAELFADPGDVLLLPDKLWGNYRLCFENHMGAKVETFPFFAGQGFNIDGFAEALEKNAEDRDKLIVILNFPNNPTGYMPTVEEGDAIVAALVAQAERGTNLVVLTDDAYFGLFYHLGGESMTESLFGKLANLHPRILAVKLDGATKELFVWGLRCGFVTFGPGNGGTAEEVCEVLDAKTRGLIRAGVSNVPHLSQTLVQLALESPEIDDERAAKSKTLCERATQVYEVANSPRFSESWSVYPFNSGYFMLIQVKGVEAERLRVHLLDQHGVGLIATGKHDLRVAFSCLEANDVEALFEIVHQAIQELV
ncbi:MAG: aminotransferase class I/II-fold pyridoxal phosphate-dependent enzyme [Myxococcota bacterium]|jgi:aspartate/methionine/tyrosine aminotransferase|nr:aminotransferase class I/II-fold pyridoxal phosphate-dependent enzyme [Myxococcota bacterium]